MSAGYALYSGEEKRYLEMIPSRGVGKKIQEDITQESTEVTCMWVSRCYSSVSDRAFFYFTYTMDIARSSKRYIMAGSFEEKIKKLHSVPFLK